MSDNKHIKTLENLIKRMDERIEERIEEIMNSQAKADDCDSKDYTHRTELNIRFEIIVNGNCMLCGKPLSGTRLYLCEECSKKGANDETE